MRSKLLLWLLCFGGCAQLCAQAPSPAVAETAKQDLIVERLSTTDVFQNDGNYSRRVEYRARLLTEAAVKQATVVIFPYDNRREDMKVEYVRVLKADGSKVEAQLSAIEEMSSQVQREANTYADFREKHVPVRALDPGDRLEYAYTSTSRAPFAPGQFWVEHAFLTSVPVLSEELVIDVPADRSLKMKWAEGVKPEVKEADGRRQYRVTHSQATPQPEENIATAPPAVRLSTFQSWVEVGRWFGGAMKELDSPSAEIKAKVAELAPPKLDARARATALYDFVATGIRTVGLALGNRPPYPTPAADVLKNGYGDMIDKYALLSAMMSAAGISSYPVLVRTAEHFDGDVPSPAQFDYLVGKVSIGGTDVWLDPTLQVAPFGHLVAQLRGKNGLEVPSTAAAHLVITPAESVVDSVSDTEIRGSIDAFGKLTVGVVRTMRGDAEVGARAAFRLTPAKDWPAVVEKVDSLTGLSGEVSDLTVSDPADLEKPFRIEYSLSNPIFLAWGRSQKLTPPASQIGMIRAFAPEQRATPIPLQKQEERVEVDLTLPAGISANPPLSINLHRDFADYSSKYTAEGSTVKIRRVLKIVGGDLARARYIEHNEFVDTVAKDQQQAFAISGSPAGPAVSAPVKLPEAVPLEPSVAKQSALFQEAFNAEQYGEVMKAEQGFKKVLAEEPKNAAAWYELGQVYALLRRRDAAIDAWKKAVEIDAFQQPALKRLAMTTWQLGRYADAEAAVRKLLDITPIDAPLRMNLGELLVLQGKTKDGIPYLESAVSQDPKNSWARARLAHAYLQAGEVERGMATLQDLVRDFPNPLIYNQAASILADAGVKLDVAEQYANDGLRIIYPLLANAGAEGPPDRMHAMARRVLGFSWDSLGWIYFKQGEISKASEYLNAAWVYGQNGDAGGHLAQVLIKQGRTAEASRVLGDALAASQDFVTPTTASSRARLEKLVGKARAQQLIASGTNHLQEMRTIRLGPQKKKLNGSAELNVIFEGGQGPRIEFLSGSRELAVLKPALQAADFHFKLPADVHMPLAMKGILSCSMLSGCMMVLTTPAGLPPPGIFEGAVLGLR